MSMLWDMEKTEMEKRNVLFQEEDKDSYIGTNAIWALAGICSRTSIPFRALRNHPRSSLSLSYSARIPPRVATPAIFR